MHLQELSDYSHEAEFKRQAAFYHATVKDTRPKESKAKSTTTTRLEVFNKTVATQFDDQQLGLWGDGSPTNI